MTARALALRGVPAPGAAAANDEPLVATAHDALVVRLFCVWLVLQCFYWQALPFLRLNVGVPLTPDRLAMLLLLLAFAARMSKPRPAARPSAVAVILGRTIFIFGLIIGTSLLFSGADSTRPTFGNLTQVFNLALLPALSFFIARRIQYTRATIRLLLGFFAVFGVYLSVTSLAEHYGVDALVFPKYILDPSVGIHFGRSRGPFVDTIGNGGMMLLSFVSACCLSALHTGARRVMLLLLMLVLLAAVYFTDTRGVWLSLAVITATCVVLRTRLRRPVTVICGAMLIAFLVGVGSKFSISEPTLFTRRQNTVDNRLDNFEIAWNAFKANPVMGLGYGKFATEWHKYYNRANSRLGIGMDDGNHSTVLGLLADVGLVGTIPFGLVIGCSLLVCLRAYRDLNGEEFMLERQLAVVGLTAVQAMVILSLTNDLRSQPTINVPTLWFVGMVASIHASGRAWMASGRERPAAVPMPSGRPARTSASVSWHQRPHQGWRRSS